jgi:hypothetical protein
MNDDPAVAHAFPDAVQPLAGAVELELRNEVAGEREEAVDPHLSIAAGQLDGRDLVGTLARQVIRREG